MMSWNLTHPLQLSNFSCNFHVPRVPGILLNSSHCSHSRNGKFRILPRLARGSESQADLPQHQHQTNQLMSSVQSSPNMSRASGSTLGYSFEAWHLKWKVSPSVGESFPCQPHESNTFVVGVGAHLSMGYLRGSTGDQPGINSRNSRMNQPGFPTWPNLEVPFPCARPSV